MSAAPAPTPHRRRAPAWLLKLLLAVGAPLLLFGGLEAALRVAGYGHETAYFIREPGQPEGVFRSNPNYTGRFLPASFGLKPVTFRLNRTKPVGTARVFLIGESAAMGVPEPGFALAPQLQAQLETLLPGRRIEVLNLGITAINSHALVPIVRQAVQFEPDLLIFYMGNNEVVGPYGPGSALTASTPSLAVIRASVALRATRTGQALQTLWQRAAGAGAGAPRAWRGMEMFVDRHVAASDARLSTVHAHFEANLETMLRAAEAAGVPALVSTVAVNLRDCAPFGSTVTIDPIQAAAPDETILRATLAASPDSADAHFRLARLLDARGDTEAARPHYLLALEHDTLRFRADETLNAILRRVTADRPGTHLVDSAHLLGSAATSEGPPAGADLFFEHVHLTWEGNAALARALAPAAAALLAPDQPVTGTPLDPARLADRLGFTPAARLAQWQAMDELVTRPPFTAQSTYAADRTRALGAMAALQTQLDGAGLRDAAVRARAALQARPGSAFLAFHAAKLADQIGDPAAALSLLDTHERLAPVSAESTVLRSYLEARTGRAGVARDRLLRLATTEPYYPQTYPLLASIWTATGDVTAARATFANWIDRLPEHRDLRLAQARLLVAAGDTEGAAIQWRAVLERVPDDERALLPLVQHLLAADRHDEAVTLMLAAHAYNPRNAANNDRLVQVYQQRGDDRRTLEFMRDLIASGPVSPALQRDYARLQAGLGHNPAATEP